MALHDELAELRGEVGPQVFDDPVAFRAAFDDFVPEGSASTGEVSLLVGAIATGALQRLKEQLALGADPEVSIAVQAELLARDRGTSESSGAQWAMSVLAHAIGALPAQGVPTRPAPGADSIGTADRPAVAADTEVVGPAPIVHVNTTPAAPSMPAAPPTPAAVTAVAPPRRGAGALLIALAAVLAVIAVVTSALLVLRDSPADDPAEDTSSGDTTAETSSSASVYTSPTGIALGVLSTVDFRVAGKPFQLNLLIDGTTGAGSTTSASQKLTAYIELSAGPHGERGMVDRIPAGCPYFGDSYGAVIQYTGGGQFLVAWRTRNDNDYAEYGDVLPFEELVNLSGNDTPCPTG